MHVIKYLVDRSRHAFGSALKEAVKGRLTHFYPL